MKTEKKIAIANLEELFRVNLNGEYNNMLSDLEALRQDINNLSTQDIRRIKKHLKKKMDSI